MNLSSLRSKDRSSTVSVANFFFHDIWEEFLRRVPWVLRCSKSSLPYSSSSTIWISSLRFFLMSLTCARFRGGGRAFILLLKPLPISMSRRCCFFSDTAGCLGSRLRMTLKSSLITLGEESCDFLKRVRLSATVLWPWLWGSDDSNGPEIEEFWS